MKNENFDALLALAQAEYANGSLANAVRYSEQAITLIDAFTKGAPFDIVHFDGHGSVLRDPNDSLRPALHFEDAEPIDAKTFSDGLRNGGLPAVVMNACRSAYSGIHSSFPAIHNSASFAKALVDNEVPAVIAMRFIVSVQTVRPFVLSFYEHLCRSGDFALA